MILGNLFIFLWSGLVKNRKAVRTVNPIFKTEIQKFIENHRKLQKWKINYTNAQNDIIYMFVQGFLSDSFSKCTF